MAQRVPTGERDDERSMHSESSVESERIAESDMTYHHRIVTEEAAARELLVQAMERDRNAAAAARSWWEYLKNTYALVEEDTVHPDGTIARVPRVAETPPTLIPHGMDT
jgi:hypothetical protein